MCAGITTEWCQRKPRWLLSQDAVRLCLAPVNNIWYSFCDRLTVPGTVWSSKTISGTVSAAGKQYLVQFGPGKQYLLVQFGAGKQYLE